MLAFLSVLFFVIGFALAYSLWLRPLLRTRPRFAEFYDRSNSFLGALWAKLAFLKTRISAGLLMVASALLGVHDFIVPVVSTIDWTPLWEKVPPWSWPCISFAIGALFYWLRSVTAKQQEQIVAAVEAGATPAQATMLIAGGPYNGKTK